MAVTNIPCQPHEHQKYCVGFYTETEAKMAEMDTSRSIQEHHESISLFEAAWEVVWDATNN